MAKHYSMDTDPESTAKALGYELPVSPKDSYEICREIRGMRLKDAKQYLEDVLEHKKAVPFKRYKRKIKHRKGMCAGGYPEKAVRHILDVLENAENNAEYKGFDPDNMIIIHSAVSRGRMLKGWKPRAHGRATEWNQQTTNIEIILGEIKEEVEGRKGETVKEG